MILANMLKTHTKQQQAWDLLHAQSHRQDNTYHSLCGSRGALAGTRNSSMRPTWRIDPTTHRTMSERSYHGATSRSSNSMNNTDNTTNWNRCPGKRTWVLDITPIITFKKATATTCRPTCCCGGVVRAGCGRSRPRSCGDSCCLPAWSWSAWSPTSWTSSSECHLQRRSGLSVRY